MENASLVDEYGYVKDGKVFLKGYLNYEDRQIGEVKRTEQEALDYFKNRFIIAENKVSQLEKDITEAQNKGSYLTKLVQLRKKLVGFDALGDFPPLLERLDAQESLLADLISVNQLKNLEIKRALIGEAEALVDSTDWRPTADALQEVKTKWIKTGPVDKSIETEVESRFQELLDSFFQRRREFFNEQNKIIQERLDKYDELIRLAFRANRLGDLDAAFQEVRKLNNAWKQVGEVPIKKSGKLYKSFKKATTAFYAKYNDAKGIVIEKKIDPRIEVQMKMADEAERLANQADIVAAADRAKVLLNSWKEIKIPFKLQDKEINERFRAACDKIFELSYLNRVLTRKYPAFELKSQSEQIRTKIREMEYLVKREKNDLQFALQDADGLDPNNADDKMVLNKINTQKRKIAMKEVILKEFQKELTTAGY
jgi:F0F1-type ATP synthase delta subunit